MFGRPRPCPLDATEEHGDGAPPDLLFVGRDRRQGWDGKAGFIDIVESNDGDVIGDAITGIVKRPYRSESNEVVEAEHGVRRLVEGKQALHRLSSIAPVQDVDGGDEGGIGRESSVGEGLPIAAQAQTHRLGATQLLQTNHGDTSATHLHEMVGRKAGSGHVVDGNVILGRLHEMLAYQDEGKGSAVRLQVGHL